MRWLLFRIKQASLPCIIGGVHSLTNSSVVVGPQMTPRNLPKLHCRHKVFVNVALRLCLVAALIVGHCASFESQSGN